MLMTQKNYKVYVMINSWYVIIQYFDEIIIIIPNKRLKR